MRLHVIYIFCIMLFSSLSFFVGSQISGAYHRADVMLSNAQLNIGLAATYRENPETAAESVVSLFEEQAFTTLGFIERHRLLLRATKVWEKVPRLYRDLDLHVHWYPDSEVRIHDDTYELPKSEFGPYGYATSTNYEPSVRLFTELRMIEQNAAGQPATRIESK